ncbi:hypothetical protein [Kitasatospora sp. NPDC088346]|uniref:hypothetical protein n=1 Tax=Kitasatospora sp. NPDC088346 TaxID=3364073 RepID=UPI00381BF891
MQSEGLARLAIAGSPAESILIMNFRVSDLFAERRRPIVRPINGLERGALCMEDETGQAAGWSASDQTSSPVSEIVRTVAAAAVMIAIAVTHRELDAASGALLGSGFAVIAAQRRGRNE